MKIIRPSPVPLPQLARLFKLDPAWLREEAAGGRLPHVRCGRSILFDARTIKNILVERLAKAALEVQS